MRLNFEKEQTNWVRMTAFTKISLPPIFVFFAMNGAFADATGDSIPENISVSEAVTYMNSDRNSASRPREIAALAVKAKRLDLVDLCLADKLRMTHDLIDQLELAPDSEFKDQITIRIIRGKFGWSDSEWGSHGVPMVGELFSDIIARRLPGIHPEPSMLASVTARHELADKLEAAITRESSITNPKDPKQGETPDEGESTVTDTPSKPGNGSSSSSRKSTEDSNQPNWMNYWWLVIAVGGVALLYGFKGKLNDFFRR